MRSFSSWSTLAVGLLAALASAAPSSPYKSSMSKRQASGDHLVFCHFMMGIVPNRQSSADYDSDMQRAKAAGIDAFALNIGKDAYAEQQLAYAYESAEKNDMKVFISFDFNWFSPSSDASTVGGMIKNFGGKKSQLIVDGKVFVSSFAGDGLNVEQLRQAAGVDIYFAPNFHPEQTADPSAIDGALNWIAWDSDGNNRAPKPGANVTVSQGDATYTKWLGQKGYIAPVSPWFFTHFGAEVSYPKNWVFPGDLLWYNRWNEILQLQPRFIEIITWNDYGESHYVGPLSSKHTDDGNSKWANDMPHNGWLDMAKPYIQAFKAGENSPAKYITEDQLVYWYRPTLKSLNCDNTDTTGQRPDGVDTMEDAVFVVALLTEDGKVTAVSGKNSKTFDAPAGASAWKVDMGVGPQSFSLERGGQTVMSETSLREVKDQCPCGLYIYNAYVGTVPAGEPDALDKDGLTALTSGLKVSTCAATPSLTGAPPRPTANTSAPIATSAPAPETTNSPPPSPATSASPSSDVSSIPTGTVRIGTSAPATSASATSGPATPTIASTTVAQQPESGGGGCTATVTESSQVAPTNCLQSGQVWKGPNAGPDCCDGASPCCKH
ncbi:uncharacterized protein BDR25DRAFT_283669 [Lindgomyces ingoldianus]|uniref:Uncharacterized protein n=1 Tax=Lindgomyces ingoldianus TaxID=673940 RepID=A0ACB6R1N7_9PLEO|nr:uncharacterized protein BDR25DRAFT_283669 [Lindgomyces ingoldianus]KAF2473010.1 hypothetical protein BDR25DRAFT_283669 [Lindgomyces ingoldianus]